MRECFRKHSRMEQQEEKETDDDRNKRGVSMERSKEGTKKEVLAHPNQNTIIINMVLFYKNMEKVK